HARPGSRSELPRDVRRLGGCGPLLVSPHRILVRKEIGLRRRKKSVHRQPDWRFWLHPRRAADLRPVRHGGLPKDCRVAGAAQGRDDLWDGFTDYAAAVRWRDWKIGADPVVRLAA